jgi:hypothetical protein
LNQTAGLGGDAQTVGLAENLEFLDEGSNPSVKSPSPPDAWYYPTEIMNDLLGVDLPPQFIKEALTCAWEYSRCIIPHFTNWDRYIAFTRTVIIGIIAEFRGSLVDVAAGNKLLGFDLDEVLDTLFAGTPGRDEMARHFRAFLLFSAEKSSDRRDSDLFRRYVNALARSPREWFRLRDSDALARYSMAAALACNDFDGIWFTDAEWEILSEVGITLYDAVAFHKHRAEGETNSTFAYADYKMRKECYRRCREVLWSLDVAWAHSPGHLCVTNFLRFFGGPIHMMMRRYRFVEDGLMIGRPETEDVVAQTRQHVKLWNRVDAAGIQSSTTETARYRNVIAGSKKLLIDGLADMLEGSNEGDCVDCTYRHNLSYGAQASEEFGGVKLCDGCKEEWRSYLESLPARAAKVFPIRTKVSRSNDIKDVEVLEHEGAAGEEQDAGEPGEQEQEPQAEHEQQEGEEAQPEHEEQRKHEYGAPEEEQPGYEHDGGELDYGQDESGDDDY